MPSVENTENSGEDSPVIDVTDETWGKVPNGEHFDHDHHKKNIYILDFIYFCSRTKMTEGFSTSPAEKFFFFQFGAFRIQAESFLR